MMLKKHANIYVSSIWSTQKKARFRINPKRAFFKLTIFDQLEMI